MNTQGIHGTSVTLDMTGRKQDKEFRNKMDGETLSVVNVIKKGIKVQRKEWSYSDPDDWSIDHIECKDTPTSRQSPINIITKEAVYRQYGDLELHNYDTMQMHIVHYNSIYSNVTAAIKQPNGLAVLAFMFEVFVEPNPAFEDIILKLSSIVAPDSKTSLKAIPVKQLLPDKFEEFYRYDGSLTTPGCNESVIWTVFTSTIHISEEQIQQFRNLQSSEFQPKFIQNIKLVDNYRPLQNLNGRVVSTNKKSSEGICQESAKVTCHCSGTFKI